MREVLARFQGSDREHVRRAADAVLDRRRHLRVGADRRDPERDHDEPPRRAQPRSEDLLDLVRDELGSGVDRRTPSYRSAHDRHHGAHLGCAQLGVADERAVIDAHERRQPARWREVVRRVHDLRRLQPAVDARRVVARPCGQQHTRRDRHEARVRRHVVALLARAPAQRVRERAAARPPGLEAHRGSRRPPGRCRCAARAAA